MPRDTVTRSPDERLLANYCGKVLARLNAAPAGAVRPEVARLLQEIDDHTSDTASRALSRDARTQAVAGMKAFETSTLAGYETWCQRRGQEPREHTALQKTMVPGNREGEFFGASPYPWLTNVGNSCYMSTVIQCLLHCATPREYLLQLPADTPLRFELGQLTRHYVRGVTMEGTQAPAKFDVIVPHALVDILEPTFRYG